jgi:hypothetical protein
MKIFSSPTALCLAPMFMTVASAQTVFGDLVVNVFDSSGAVVAGSKLQLTQVKTNIAQEPVTDNRGNALYPRLKPSIYRLKLETAGHTDAIARIVPGEIECRRRGVAAWTEVFLVV